MESEGIASNGRLEFQDVVAVAQQVLGPKVTEPAAARAFEVLDSKAEGFIPFPELRRALTALDAKLTDREIAEVLRDADTDKDGRINYDEFMTVSPRGMAVEGAGIRKLGAECAARVVLLLSCASPVWSASPSQLMGVR